MPIDKEHAIIFKRFIHKDGFENLDNTAKNKIDHLYNNIVIVTPLIAILTISSQWMIRHSLSFSLIVLFFCSLITVSLIVHGRSIVNTAILNFESKSSPHMNDAKIITQLKKIARQYLFAGIVFGLNLGLIHSFFLLKSFLGRNGSLIYLAVIFISSLGSVIIVYQKAK